jgi:hypothetical protein
MKSICPTAVMLLALLLVPAATAAARPCGFWVVDWCAWRATSSVPFALETMRAYYVPRTPACCACPLYWVGPREPYCYVPAVGDGFEPAEFDHLGQIPNDSLLEDTHAPR